MICVHHSLSWVQILNEKDEHKCEKGFFLYFSKSHTEEDDDMLSLFLADILNLVQLEYCCERIGQKGNGCLLTIQTGLLLVPHLDKPIKKGFAYPNIQFLYSVSPKEKPQDMWSPSVKFLN